MDINITVFTPTYNRGNKLETLYRSLCEQTCKSFTWLIVDDGSNDNTKELVNRWIVENVIKINYIYQENAGKQRAVNTGVKNCETELFAFVDSDDFYTPMTVEKMINLWEDVKNDDNVAGILARRGTPDGKIMGSTNLPERIVANYHYIEKKYKFYGDTCRVYRTKVLLDNLYPEIDDKFIPENVIFVRIDLKYKLLIVNDIMSISGYLDDGYTNNIKKLLRNNPIGYKLSLQQSLRGKLRITSLVKLTVVYIIWCLRYEIKNSYIECPKKILYVVLYPISYCLFLLNKPKWIFM